MPSNPPGPVRVPLDRLGEAQGALLEVRFVNAQGETEVWMVPNDIDIDGDSFGGNAVGALRGYVKLAYLDRGVDLLLGSQKETIDRLLDHVNFHHSGLKGVFPCGFEQESK